MGLQAILGETMSAWNERSSFWNEHKSNSNNLRQLSTRSSIGLWYVLTPSQKNRHRPPLVQRDYNRFLLPMKENSPSHYYKLTPSYNLLFVLPCSHLKDRHNNYPIIAKFNFQSIVTYKKIDRNIYEVHKIYR